MTGFLNIYKETGVSSAYAVNRIKRLSKTPCGHMGTLDPLASGVLPVGVGNATRLFDYFLNKRKTYLARFRFGVTTDTLDSEGEKIIGGPVPALCEVERALPSFIGEIDQVPPKYSAKSVNGRRGYELARSGEEFTLQPKRVKVESFRLHEQVSPDEFSFEIICGAGTYIRSLARDLAFALGTNGYMSALERTQSGAFGKENSVKLDELTAENLQSFIIPTDSVISLPALHSTDGRLLNGIAVPVSEADGEYKLYINGEFYGLARVENGRAKAAKKLC